MAIVRFLNYKRQQTPALLRFVLQYTMREDKTISENKKLVTGMNCTPQSSFTEFQNTKRLYGKENGRLFYHFVQSFPIGEAVSPETAHEIALRLAAESEKLKGFEVVVSTHCDRDHIHTHFVLNSVNAETGKKFHCTQQDVEQLMRESDKIIQQYGLSVLQPAKKQKAKPMNDREYRSAERGDSWKLRLAMTIDDAMALALSREHFIELMAMEGYTVRWTAERKDITYTTPEGQKCRCSKLHEEKYLKGNMENEFRIRKEISAGAESQSEDEHADRRADRPLRSGDGRKLVGYDRSAENTERDALRDHGTADEADYAGRTWQNAFAAERSAYEIYAELREADSGVYGADGTERDGLYETDEYDDERYIHTGWEDERELFAKSLFGTGNGESVPQTQYADLADSDSAAYSLGTDTAYLFAHMSNILDNDHPTEDCTTLPRPRGQKRKQGQSMGGM